MKNLVQDGKAKRVENQTVGHTAGDILIYNSWPGIVVKDITGTTEQKTTVDGRPITGELGDGAGDIWVEGVYKLVDENPTALTDGSLVSRNSASGVVADSGSDRIGHVWRGRYTENSIDYVDVKLLGEPYEA